MKYIVFLIISSLVVGCAVGPAKFQTETTVGRVVGMAKIDGGPPRHVEEIIYLPIDGLSVPIFISVMRKPTDSFVHIVSYKEDRILQTQSMKEYEVGECVELWHSPRSDISNPEYNFVPGTLEKSDGCK